MLQLIIALLSFLTSGIGIMFLFNNTFIPEPKWFLVIGLVYVMAYVFHKVYTKTGSKKLDRMITMSTTIFGVLLISSFVYHKWTMDKFISAEVMMKMVLFLLLTLGIYLNFIVMRAEDSYKKKRGNQRIKITPEKTVYQKWKDRKESDEMKEVYLILGESAENDE